MSFIHFKTNHYVYVEADCATHGEHLLSGRTENKDSVQSLCKDCAADLPFYYDRCNLGLIKAVYSKTRKVYRKPNTRGGFDYLQGECEDVSKVVFTLRRHRV
jgi:hypothetical protein